MYKLLIVLILFLFPVDLYAADNLEEIRLKAESGDAYAQAALGSIYANGDGVKQDYKEAVKWYRLAAGKNSTAIYHLGLLNYAGKGVPRDYKKAVMWYRFAAGRGNIEAQNALGDIYYHGHIVLKDYRKAIKYYKSAAKKGNANSQNGLGRMYQNGYVVEKDLKIAYVWFSVAAKQGYIDAMKNKRVLKKTLTAKELLEARGLSEEYIKKYSK